MTNEQRKIYKQLRKKGWRASIALHSSKIQAEFNNRDDVRLVIQPDEICTIEDIEGDMFNPAVNTDIPEEKLARQREEFIDRCNNEGIVGIVGQYKCPECGSWEHADSVWGFVGEDWKDSGYDIDVMATTLDKVR